MTPIVHRALIRLAALNTSSVCLSAAELKLRLPLARTAYQCNERIDLAVLRSAAEALPASDLMLKLAGNDGSRFAFTFAVKPVGMSGGTARAVEHSHLNGWLLRPGTYGVEVTCDG